MDASFFDGLRLGTVALPSGSRLNLPVRYYDSTWVGAFFTASTARVQQLLPSNKLKPLQVWPGSSLLGIMAMEYRRVDQVEPYNEFVVAPVVQYEPRRDLPGLALFRDPLTAPQAYSRLGAYVRWMPVTTESAREGGVSLWGYRKLIGDILFEDAGADVRCRLRIGGVDAVTLQVRKRPARPSSMTIATYTEKDGQLLRTPIPLQGLMRNHRWPGSASCTLGSGIIADELRAVGMRKTSLSSLYAPQVQSILPSAEECLPL